MGRTTPLGARVADDASRIRDAWSALKRRPADLERRVGDVVALVLRSDAWRAGLVVVPATVLLVVAYRHRFMSDDGLIYTRVVRQVLAGNGPVFNLTERAEASTSTLWPWLLAFGSWGTGVSPDRLAVLGGIALTVLGLGVAVHASCRLHAPDRKSWPLLPAGVLVLIALPPAWDFASSGLETGLETFWLGACWWLLVQSRSGLGGLRGVLVAAAFGLGPMVRPNLALVSACFLIALWAVVRPDWRGTVGWLLGAGALPVAYQIFRAGFYGLLLPLPALTKEGISLHWPRGLRYVSDFVVPYRLTWPLVCVALLVGYVLVLRRRTWRDAVVLATPVVCGLLMATYVIAIGGDWMHARMLLPPLMMLLLPVLVVRALGTTAVIAAAILVWAILGATPLRPSVPRKLAFQDMRGVSLAVAKHPNPVTGRQWVRGSPELAEQVDAALASGSPTLLYGDYSKMLVARARPDVGAQVVVYGGFLGLQGAVVPLDQTVADMWSLAYPLGAHFVLTERVVFPGHEKPVPWVWFLADYADPAAPPAPGVSPEEVAAARRALGCGELAELQRSVRAPMSASRFWQNLAGSLRRTTLRVPPDPFAAERRFCANS